LKIRSSASYNQDNRFQEISENEFKISEQRSALLRDIQHLEVAREYMINTEGDVSLVQNGIVSQIHEEATLKDVAGDSDTKVDPFDPLMDEFTPQMHAELGEFLRRPIQIFRVPLTLSAQNQTVLDPWALFTNTPSIRAKFRNFGLFRGDLHLRIAVSGTPFHYGRVMFSYIPLATSNSVANAYRTNISSGAQAFSVQNPMFYTYLSQQNGAKVIDVKANKPLEMTLPFVCPSPMCRLYQANSSSSLGAGTTYPEIGELGRLFFGCLNPIESVSTTPTVPYLYIYGWMENVSLAIPTGTQVVITTEGADERVIGPVERISGVMASIAGKLQAAPVIGPWAMASRSVLQGVSSFAALFGWSYPNRIEPAHRVKPEPFQNGANCIGMDTGKRITLDPKQEVSIDPQLMGSYGDDMVLSVLCERESYLDTVVWSPSAAPLSILRQFLVTPRVGKTATNPVGGSALIIQPTALSYASAPFSFWNGEMVFSFEVVASSFARGKFLIGFEPNIRQSVLIGANLNLNKQYYVVVDVQETDKVELCVPWAFHQPWCQNLDNARIPYSIGADIILAGVREFSNGYIFVAPLTELQSPDGSGVNINVYVRGKNMTFAYPDYSRLPVSSQVFVSSAGFMEEKINTEGEEVSSSSPMVLAPENISCIQLMESPINISKASMTGFGDPVVSFRSLLKRFTGVANVLVSSVATAPTGITFSIPAFPLKTTLFGTSGLQRGVPETDLFTYLSYAYMGYRGGIRHRVRLIGNIPSTALNHVRVTLGGPASTVPDYTNGPSLDFLNARGVGTVEFVPHTNAGIEFEVPYYSGNLFLRAPQIEPAPADNTSVSNLLRAIVLSYDATTDLLIPGAPVRIIHDCASAEDFSFGHFVGAPPFSF
jgi:hypothetical protein